MSNLAQERLATRLTFVMALLVAVSLLGVGWVLYRPGSASAETVSAPAPVAAER